MAKPLPACFPANNSFAAKIEDLRDSYDNDIQSRATTHAKTLASKPNSGTPNQHDETVYCQHDRDTVASFYHQLALAGVLARKAQDSPMGRLHALCRVAKGVKTDNKTQFHAGCTACTFVHHVEDELYQIVQESLDMYEGLCIDCDLRDQKDGCQCCYSAEGDVDVVWPIPAWWLFGNCLGLRLLERDPPHAEGQPPSCLLYTSPSPRD